MGLVSSQLPLKTLVPLCRQLSTAYDAGIPIVQALALVQRESKHATMRAVLQRMQDAIRRGNSLGDALKAESKYLPPYLVETISAGEVGGRLDAMFSDLANYFEDRLTMRRQMVSAMSYPIIVLIVAWFLGTFALRLIGSVMGSVFGKGDFTFSSFFASYLLFQFLALLVALVFVVIGVILARMGLLKWIWGFFTTHIWPFSPVTKRFCLARFFRSMSLLIGAGLPIKNCIERSAAVASNPYIERDLLQAIPKVLSGSTLVEAFSGCRYLLPTAREMISVGEQSGKLEDQLRKVALYFTEEAAHAVQVAGKVLYVVIQLIVAALVGYVIISFYLTYLGGLMNGLE